MTYGGGDVVYGDDSFKGEDYSRPWVLISNDTHPFHGDQYIVLGLTTKSWHDGLLAIDLSFEGSLSGARRPQLRGSMSD